jgi:hypothetical protein
MEVEVPTSPHTSAGHATAKVRDRCREVLDRLFAYSRFAGSWSLFGRGSLIEPRISDQRISESSE